MSATLEAAPQRPVVEYGYVPGPAVSVALLLPMERIPRAPLTSWAERLSSEILDCRRRLRKVRALCNAVATIANNAALVASLHGAESVARALCDRQMSWQHRLSRRSRDPAVAAHVVQPWINLARLDGMSGSWQEALARLARLQDYRSKGCLQLGSFHVTECGWQVAASTRQQFAEGFDNVYVIDSLKVLLLNGEFAEVLAFASRLRPEWRNDLVRFAMEASAVAAGRLGDPAGAHQIAATASSAAVGWEQVVFKIRMAEIFAVAGDPDRARGIVAPVVAVVEKVSPARKQALQTLYILQRLSTLCREIGLEREARAVAKDVYDGARAVGDEVFEIESLRTLSATSPGQERTRWEEALARREAITLYRKYQRRGREAAQVPVLDGLYEQLGEFLAD